MTKGYKVFNSDWTCRGFQYEVGKTYEEDVTPSVCNRGFHFCKQAKDCFNYYTFDPNNKVAEVIALGEVAEEGDKCCTNIIKIEREITWEEVLTIVNTGKACTGLCNSGDCNSGDWNKTNFSAGVFCTEQPKLIMFNKPTEMTFDQWRCSDACILLDRINFRPTKFIWSDDMTDEEKTTHPDWETTQGYLKKLDISECCHDWWMNLNMNEKCIIQNMPNFDAEIFEAITGIQV